ELPARHEIGERGEMRGVRSRVRHRRVPDPCGVAGAPHHRNRGATFADELRERCELDRVPVDGVDDGVEPIRVPLADRGGPFLPTVPKTRSPTENPVTSWPTASTVPARSLPIPAGNRYFMKSFIAPMATPTSNALTDEACTRTNTSSGPGVGSGRSITAGGP